MRGIFTRLHLFGYRQPLQLHVGSLQQFVQGKTRDELNYILNNSTQSELELYLNIIKLISEKNKTLI